MKVETKKNQILRQEIDQVKEDVSKAEASQEELHQEKILGEYETQRVVEEVKNNIKALVDKINALEERSWKPNVNGMPTSRRK